MEDCPICYESVDISTGHCTLSCKHTFHINCLTHWSATNPSCPLCRHELSDKEVAVKKVKHIFEIPQTSQATQGRHIRIGNGVVVTEGDVHAVQHATGATRGEAIIALRMMFGEVELAIDYHVEPDLRNRPVQAPRYPLDEPTDDQSTAWFLQRLFDETYTGYKWNSYEDVLYRMNYRVSVSNWTHLEFQKEESGEKLECGYASA